MKRTLLPLAIMLLLSPAIRAQQPPSPPIAPVPPAPSIPNLGKWWKNSQVVQDLKLTEAQVNQIEETFLEHRSKLSDARAELERQEKSLQALLAASQLDETKIGEQTAQVLSARGKLEQDNTSMMIAFRRLLSAEQWRKLEDIRQASKNLAPPPPPPPAAPPAPPPPPPPPPLKVGATDSGEPVYKIAGIVKAPVVLYQPLPQYTLEARENKVEGLVLLEAVIDKEGTAHNVKVIRSLGYGLDESAANAVEKDWRFQPGTLNGVPVNVLAHIELSFRLK